MLLDSNILIYAAQPEHAELRALIAEHAPAVSVISYIEVLGYHKLQEKDRARLEEFFHAAEEVFPLSDRVVQQAVGLRQQRRMSLGGWHSPSSMSAAPPFRGSPPTRSSTWMLWFPPPMTCPLQSSSSSGSDTFTGAISESLYSEAFRGPAHLLCEYAALKCSLAERSRDDREAYGQAKSAFVEEITRAAAGEQRTIGDH